jgi:hypothetical protein
MAANFGNYGKSIDDLVKVRNSFNIDDRTSSMDTKTIQPNYLFYGEFTGEPSINIKSNHIRSVRYEQHTFKQEGQYHGPGILNTFPVLDRQENGAYELSMVLEEDADGNVFSFIENLKTLIIKSDGVYNSIADIKKLNFELTVLYTKPFIITFTGIYFQKAEMNEYNYGDNEMKLYTITFAYDTYKVSYSPTSDVYFDFKK